MIELKVHNINDTSLDVIANCDFYLKSEADKVIADLEESHKMEVERLLIEIAELKDKLRYYPIMVAIIESDKLEIACDKYKIRHQKYKRCLAMAKWCEIGAQFQHNIVMQFDNPFYIKRAEWLEKWHKRWLELAEKFNEAK